MHRGHEERVRYTCGICAFSLWLPIARLQVSTLGLYDDARFPGRCLLVFRRHAEELNDLSHEEASAFIADLQLASRAIAAVTKPARMNYALLGNQEPHVHFHLIPRPIGDPVPTKTPWHHPDPVRKLDARSRDTLVDAIGGRLTRSL